MVTVSVMAGRAEFRAIFLTPPPPMLNSIRSAPGLALALVMAQRREPSPASWVLRTVKVLSSSRASRTSMLGRLREGVRRTRGVRVCLRQEKRENFIDASEGRWPDDGRL